MAGASPHAASMFEGPLADAIPAVLDRFWPSAPEAERARAQSALRALHAEFTLALRQVDVNALEAQNPSLFISGWRPFVGWVCGSGFAYEFLIRPLVNGFIGAFGASFFFPGIPVDALSSLLFGLLGLGAFRTVEKVQGVARK